MTSSGCIAGRDQNVGAALLIERQHLLPLAAEGMDLARTSFPTVNSMGCVKVLTNAYSVPLKAGAEVHAKVYASYGGSLAGRPMRGSCMSAAMAGSNRCSNWSITWTCCRASPGALAGSRPLAQQRRAGLWPESFDAMWQALNVRHGKQDGTRQMIDLLKLAKQNGHGRLRAAIEMALATGCTDAAAVQHLFQRRI